MEEYKTREEVEAKLGKTWNTRELQESFEVLGFLFSYCVVKCKTTGKKGSLDFSRFTFDGSPVRLYFGLSWE